MPLTAVDALCPLVLRVPAEARIADCALHLRSQHPTHAAVFDQDRFLGLCSLREALLTSPQRIFVDLLPRTPLPSLAPDTPLPEIGRLLSQYAVDALPVLDRDGQLLGMVTQASLLGACLREVEALAEQREAARERLEDCVAQRTAELLALNTALHAEIADRKKTEAELARHRNYLRLIIDTIPACITIVTPEGRIQEINPVGIPMLGASSTGQVVSRSILDWIIPEHAAEFLGHLQRAGPQQSEEWEYQMVSPTGEAVWMRSIAAALPRQPDEPPQILLITWDINERRLFQQQMQQLQSELAHVARLSTMGEMATGLAHELNQPLAAIAALASAGLTLLSADKDQQRVLADLLHRIAGQTERAGRIIHRLRALVRKRQEICTVVDVNATIQDILDLIKSDPQFAEYRIRTDFCSSLPPVECDPVQLQQVVMNLVRNGMEAMVDVPDEQRELIVQTRLASPAEIQVTVSDRGRGLKPEETARLFEPFFTTKPQGLGLGLSISRSIIEAQGGQLWMTENPTGGLSFHFKLPIRPREAN